MKDEIRIFKIKIPNSDSRFKNIKINKSVSYGERCLEGKRPRVGFSLLKDQLQNDEDFQEVYHGSINTLL